jgi:hypothetical protein
MGGQKTALILKTHMGRQEYGKHRRGLEAGVDWRVITQQNGVW